MLKNKTAQLVWQTVYCVLAFIGVLCSFGFFDRDFNQDFYVYYTNLSNYICAGVMSAALVRTYRQVKNGEEGFCGTAPGFSFLCVILILVTFLVYNILLADQSFLEYITSLSNVLMHCILPLLFIFHWVLFYEHGNMRWYQPLLCMVMPLVYVICILIRAALLPPNADTVVYPYFFLNLEALGVGGFIGWISLLLLVFLVIGYAFLALDRLWKRRNRKG
ncbi:MAG: Pr6Pr family membrane protein [Clostridia bacterium]|nr:Pr6Pr family membrane protein [Clostridia bacterium]